MLISIDKNLALLAMAKTGTTAVEQAIAPLCDIVLQGTPRVKHMQLRRFERFLRPYLATLDAEDVETACVFREPLDWLGSWYRYRSRPALDGKSNSTAGLSFADFVDAYLSDDPPAFARVGRPSRFVSRSDGSVGITHLFRYDTFETYVRFLESRFGVPLDLKQVNVSPNGDTTLPHALRLKAQDAMADDYEIYESIASV